MDLNTVPWTRPELIDFACLVVATVMVVAFPLGYGIRARLRDPLALSVVVATSLTAAAFVLSVVFTLLTHAGVVLDPLVAHWLSRVLVLGVGLGKLQLLIMLLRSVPRQPPRPQRRTAAESVDTT